MTATDFDFNLTRNEIIEQALQLIGELPAGGFMSGEQIVQGNRILNLVIKEWEAKGIFLWSYTEDAVIITGGTSFVTLGNHIIGIESATYENNNTDIPVEIVSYFEYFNQPDKLSSGDHPSMIALNFDRSERNLYVYPVPVNDLTLNLIVVQRMQDMDDADGYPAIPQKYLNTLVYDLAAELANYYQLDIKERGYLDGVANQKMARNKKQEIDFSKFATINSAFLTRRRR